MTWAPAFATQPGNPSPSPEGMPATLTEVQSNPFVVSKKLWSGDKWHFFFHIGLQGEAGERQTQQVTRNEAQGRVLLEAAIQAECAGGILSSQERRSEPLVWLQAEWWVAAHEGDLHPRCPHL